MFKRQSLMCLAGLVLMALFTACDSSTGVDDPSASNQCTFVITNSTGVAMRVLIYNDVSSNPVVDKARIANGTSQTYGVAYNTNVRVYYGTWSELYGQWGTEDKFHLYAGTPGNGDTIRLTATRADT